MALTIAALKSHLPTSTAPFIVHTTWSDSVEYERLVDIMAAGRTTLTKPDIAGCLELFAEEISKLVADGKRVKTLLGSFYLCASGKLEGVDQAFTPRIDGSEHDIRLHFRPDRDYESRTRGLTLVDRQRRFDRQAPLIDVVHGLMGGEELKASPGDHLRIRGERLKFDPSDPELGLFFVNGSSTRSQSYAEILPASFIAEVPPGLAPGSYTLTLRTKTGTEELHEGRLAKPFIVE